MFNPVHVVVVQGLKDGLALRITFMCIYPFTCSRRGGCNDRTSNRLIRRMRDHQPAWSTNEGWQMPLEVLWLNACPRRNTLCFADGKRRVVFYDRGSMFSGCRGRRP